MSRWKISSLSVVFSLLATNAVVGDENVIGRTPTSSEIALFDIDVRPDGMGLPVGQGSVADGEELYDDKCASCHGTFGEGSERYPALAGGQNTLDQERPMKTIGSYWPYAAPLFDYTYRTMPFGDAQSMGVDETYAILAYVFYLNDLVPEETVLDKETLLAIVMPNAAGFVMASNKADTPQIRCMKDCKQAVRVHSHAGALDVTPNKDEEK